MKSSAGSTCRFLLFFQAQLFTQRGRIAGHLSNMEWDTFDETTFPDNFDKSEFSQSSDSQTSSASFESYSSSELGSLFAQYVRPDEDFLTRTIDELVSLIEANETEFPMPFSPGLGISDADVYVNLDSNSMDTVIVKEVPTENMTMLIPPQQVQDELVDYVKTSETAFDAPQFPVIPEQDLPEELRPRKQRKSRLSTRKSKLPRKNPVPEVAIGYVLPPIFVRSSTASQAKRELLHKFSDSQISGLSSEDFETHVFEFYYPRNGERKSLTRRMFKTIQAIDKDPEKHRIDPISVAKTTDIIYDTISGLESRSWIQREKVEALVTLATIFGRLETSTNATWTLPPTRGKLTTLTNAKYLNYIVDMLELTLSQVFHELDRKIFADTSYVSRATVDIDFGHIFPSLALSTYFGTDLYVCLNKSQTPGKPFVYKQCMEIMSGLDCLDMDKILVRNVKFLDAEPVQSLCRELSDSAVTRCFGITNANVLNVFKLARYFVASRVPLETDLDYEFPSPGYALGLALSNLSAREIFDRKMLITHSKKIATLDQELQNELGKIARVMIVYENTSVARGTFEILKTGNGGKITGVVNGTGSIWWIMLE